MKELTTQEKADRFDEAIERLRNAFYDNSGRMCEEYRKAVIRIIEPIFPELKESEDEIVRKWIIDYLNNRILNSSILDEKESCKKAIAWLKKQGEQKSADKIEPKFKIGDFLVNDFCMGKVIKLTNDAYLLDTGQGIPFSCEHNAHLWTLADAKDGDVLVSFTKYPFIYNGKFDETFVGAYCGLTTNNNNFEKSISDCCWAYNKNIIPATKEQCGFLFQKMKEEGYGWDAEKKDLKKIKQKPLDKVEPKFKVGDWIVSNVSHEDYRICKILNIENGEYVIESIYGYQGHNNFETFDKNYHLWTIQDAKEGDILFQDLMSGKTFIYNGVNLDMAILYSYIISNDGEDVLPYNIGKPNTGIGNIEENKNIIYPAIKEQRNLLFQKMKEEGYEWDAEKKELKIIDWSKHIKYEPNSPSITKEHPTWGEEDECILNGILADYKSMCKTYRNWLESLKNRVQPQPKQEWSEEERQIIKDAACCILDCVNTAETKEEEERLEELADKLQDLRPQNTWRPSDEQMEFLWKYAEQNNYDGSVLTSLYNDLKKLRKE